MTPLERKPMTLRPLLRILVGALLVSFTATSCATRLPREERARRIETYKENCGKYLAMSKWEQAQDQAMKGLELDKDHFLLRLYLGRALLQRGDLDSILRSVYTLESLDAEGDFRVPLSLAEALERKGVAYADGAGAIESGMRFTEAPDPKAKADEMRETAAKAFVRSKEQYENALKLQPTDTKVLNGLVRVTALQGNYEESIAWCNSIIRITSDDRRFWEERRDRTDISPQEERRMTKNIQALDRLEMGIHLHAATIQKGKLNQPVDALRSLDAIVAFDPNVPEIHSQRGGLLVELNRYEEAIAALDKFISMTPREFNHADVKRAMQLRLTCETALAGRTDS
jgi:tetratricopeptide (TPR) repeat protein